MTQRGPDYAHDLSSAEQATLDRLLARVGPRRPRGITVPVTAGLAAAAILLVVAAALTYVPTITAPDPVRMRAGATTSAPVLFDQLADAANLSSTAQDPTPTGRPTTMGRSRLEVSVVRDGDQCRAGAIEVVSTMFTASVWPDALMGRATLQWTSPPITAYEVAGCPRPATGPDKPPAPLADTSSYSLSLVKGWAVMTTQVPDAVGLPPFSDPRALGDSIPLRLIAADPYQVIAVLDKLSYGQSAAETSGSAAAGPAPLVPVDPAARAAWNEARWWTLWTDFMTSPLITPAQRVAALRAASSRIGVTAAEPGIRLDATDVSGRAAVSLQTPSLRDNAVVTAVVSFDPHTGALLQRVVSSSDSSDSPDSPNGPARSARTYDITVFDP